MRGVQANEREKYKSKQDWRTAKHSPSGEPYMLGPITDEYTWVQRFTSTCEDPKEYLLKHLIIFISVSFHFFFFFFFLFLFCFLRWILYFLSNERRWRTTPIIISFFLCKILIPLVGKYWNRFMLKLYIVLLLYFKRCT